MASMAEPRPGAMTALIPIASSRLGKARKMSKNWESTASVLPPKYPAISPKKMPMVEGEAGGGYPHGQRDPGAVDQAGEDVAAYAVGAEQDAAAGRLLQAAQVRCSGS